MDREILFRGKRIDNGEWVEGYYARSGGGFILKDNGLTYGGFEMFDVVPKTICQYTGSTDKNGKKIFEGDIVDVFDDILKIVWDEIYASFCFVRTDSQNREFYKYFFGEGCGEEDCEVIGNIFDNPDLLKEGGKSEVES